VIRVLIVDDHQVVRQGLRFLLEQETGIEVVGECADGPSAVRAVHTLEPTVVLLDLFLPGLDDISVLTQIKQERPATEVLILTYPPMTSICWPRSAPARLPSFPKRPASTRSSGRCGPPPAARAFLSRGGIDVDIPTGMTSGSYVFRQVHMSTARGGLAILTVTAVLLLVSTALFRRRDLA